MFSVYKITNLINQKSYIGSSIRVEKRWRQHKNTAFNPNDKKYKYPLYCAFRKYGLENFSFEILKDDFDSEQEMQEYERDMILFYNSLQNGYNQTLRTSSSDIAKENRQKYISKISQKCAKVDRNGNIIEIYNSYHDAARKNGLDGDAQASSIRRVCKGFQSSYYEIIFRDLDENNNIIPQEIKRPRGKKKIIGIKVEDPTEEIYFNSVSEAAREMHIDRSSISKCLNGSTKYSQVKGYLWREINLDGDIIEIEPTVEDYLKQYNEKNPLINGERHTITEWCNIYNITTACYYNRRKKGMGVIEAITTPKRR